MGKDLVEAIDVALILDQCGPRQKIEGLDVILDKTDLHAVHQSQEFPERDRHLGGLEFEEEGDEHRSAILSSLSRSQVIGRGLIDLVDPVAEQQMRMAAPAVERRFVGIVIREVVGRHA